MTDTTIKSHNDFLTFARSNGFNRTATSAMHHAGWWTVTTIRAWALVCIEHATSTWKKNFSMAIIETYMKGGKEFSRRRAPVTASEKSSAAQMANQIAWDLLNDYLEIIRQVRVLHLDDSLIHEIGDAFCLIAEKMAEYEEVQDLTTISRWMAGDRLDPHSTSFEPTAELCLDQAPDSGYNDNGDEESVAFGCDMNGEWWEEQFSADSRLFAKVQIDDELDIRHGQWVEDKTRFVPNWDHINEVSRRQEEIKDDVLRQISEARTVGRCAQISQYCKMLSVDNRARQNGESIYDMNPKTFALRERTWGLTFQRFSLCMNEVARKACQIKWPNAKPENTLLTGLIGVDEDSRAHARKRAAQLTSWLQANLGKQFQVYPIDIYSNINDVPEDIMEAGGRVGEFMIEDAERHDASLQNFEKSLDEFLSHYSKLNALPRVRTFYADDDEWETWIGSPSNVPTLKVSLSNLFNL